MTAATKPIAPADILDDLGRKGEPQDAEAEMAVLGSLVLNNDLIGEVIDVIEADAFYHPRNSAVFQAIVELYTAMKACDLVTLKSELERQGKLEKIGGVEYLAQLVDTVPSAANAVHYAQIVRQKSILRALLRTCDKIKIEARESGDDAQRILDRAQELIYQTAAKRGKEEVAKLGDILKSTFQQITDIHDRKQRILGMPSGFHELDDFMSGLQKAQLYVIAGRPSMGKTSLAMRMIENVGLEQGKSVLFFSLEMAAAQIAQQMLCSHCRVDSHKLRTGMLGEEEYQKLLLGAGTLHEAPIFVDDSADLSDLELRARARRYKAQFGVDLIVVDYLQKMHVKGAESRQQEISRISSSLKSLAKELELPVIALAQLNRSPEGREGKKPELSDLRESGAIEQDADVVILLYREEYYNPDTEKKNVCEVRIAKNRTGPTDTVELAFIKQYTRFENLAPQRPG